LIIAVLVCFVRSRAVWILIAAFDVMVIVVYFAVAGIRQPPYEIWGVLIKVLQLVLLAAVVYLAVRAPKRQAKPQRTGAQPAPRPSVVYAVTGNSSSQDEDRRHRR
jgi:hydrogenase-4 membrane subunit HyfE